MSISRTLAACLLITAAADAADKRLISETDMFRFVWIADPQISPDGKAVAFVRVSVNKKKDGYDTAIWVVPSDGSEPARPLTNGSDTNPRWSPDGRWLAFNRSVEKDGRPQPGQLWLLPVHGGEASVLTDLPKGAGAAEWSPDSSTIAFTSTTSDKDLAKKDAKPDLDKEERESDVRVITRATYRLNGPGYLDPTRPAHIWALSLPRDASLPKPRRVTSGSFSEASLRWSPGSFAWRRKSAARPHGPFARRPSCSARSVCCGSLCSRRDSSIRGWGSGRPYSARRRPATPCWGC